MTTRPTTAMARLRAVWLGHRGSILILAVLSVAYVTLMARPSHLGSAEEFVASLSAGRPTVIAFYSNL